MRDNTPYRLVKVPIIEPITPPDLYEHTPLDWDKYGEYPRFIRPVRPPNVRYEIMKERIKGEIGRAHV